LVLLENELFDFLKTTADAAFSVNEQGEILSWNKAAEQLFGYPSSEVLGKGCYQVLRGRGALGTQVCHEGCSILECSDGNTEIPNFDLQVSLHSGKRLWVNVSTLVWKNPRNQHRVVVHLAHDISQQKKTEQATEKMLQVSRQLNKVAAAMAPAASPVATLSEQELHILKLFAAGKNSPGIAKELRISLQTLRNHLHHINQKLRTHNRLEAVMHAIQRELI
jgi:PAS domain S-box-containing protein